MIKWIKLLRPGKTDEERIAREREITHLKHEIKNSIQAVQSGNRILQSMSGVVELNRRSKAP